MLEDKIKTESKLEAPLNTGKQVLKTFEPEFVTKILVSCLICKQHFHHTSKEPSSEATLQLIQWIQQHHHEGEVSLSCVSTVSNKTNHSILIYV